MQRSEHELVVEAIAPEGTVAPQRPQKVTTTPAPKLDPQQSRKRLMRDLRSLQEDPPDGANATPKDDDIMKWDAVIFGPEDTIWDGGIFNLVLTFTDEYPMLPPQVKFTSKIFHPNVYASGQICMDIMKSEWSPALDIRALLLCIRSLLCDPNPRSAANAEAAEMLTNSKQEYEKRVRAIVEESILAADAA